MSLSIPAHDLKVSSWNLGWDMSGVSGAGAWRLTRGVKVEIAELLGTCAGIVVSRVESLVAVLSAPPFRVHSLLDKAHQALLRGEVGESLVVLQRLGGRLGDEDVVAKVERLGRDGEVSRVRGEDDHGGALGEGSEGVLVCERERGTHGN